ncbi:hypothetical protein N7492_003252 [Penicillium capsulatum]|uniref:tRNA(Phe) 7-[(3-amino-3-carboxypropyl)-4-demethylwyosine(37)-N(4)]-methyltransferase n=1 Tax=Penicillium capsulatum TaxID=69766 RepID=A0A9W9ILM9_9EURO|nr:hypothetical protein N7492_003252 [Penicillium capsulatum]
MSAVNIPAVFEIRKTKILEELSLPDTEYTDLSPKGSVDEGIRDLIREINALPGLVTTSSCAGRISVFLEGHKKTDPTQQEPESQRQFAASGGKGTGRWLYVSHDPMVRAPEQGADVPKSLLQVFGMLPGNGKPPTSSQALRLVRFHFDPLILHIMAATLIHAQPVLGAASASGFRESGLQSLRCLDSDGPSPIVAVRSSGLSLESVIGYCEQDEGSGEPVIRSLVTEEYLEMLVALSNERFMINTDRKERFRRSLMEAGSSQPQGHSKGKTKGKPADWEDPTARKERMRAEGLARKKLLENQKAAEPMEPTGLEEGPSR